MIRAEYCVLPHGPAWAIRHREKHFPYSSESTAMKAAIDVAYKAGTAGFDAVVLVQRADGAAEAVWTYGQDSPPSLV
ncbi:MAG: DUF2188 domain-containing protein [Alphaproteobacteria bacterium]|nr:MAG: DUF2188 domain-containing protein [Alphaproteobacteria bacterium]